MVESVCSARDLGSILGWGDPLEKGMTTHSSVLAWRIPWTEEPGGLQSMYCKRSDTAEPLPQLTPYTLIHNDKFKTFLN